jgi:hypothetical protein
MAFAAAGAGIAGRPMSAPVRLWHYTSEAHHLPLILRDGSIHPATVGIGTHERPVVWFSSRQDYEPTAIKVARDLPDGSSQLGELADQIEAVGAARIGIDPGAALPWARLVKAAKISPTTQRRLIRAARAVGGSAADWFGVVGEVPRPLWRAVQVMRAGRWVAADDETRTD